MIVSLDVAFRAIGWSAIDTGRIVAYGTIRTEKDKRKSVKVSDDYAFRCAQLCSALKGLIKQYEPAGIIGELPGGSQSARAAKLLGGAVAVVVSVATCYDLPCEWISEGDSKKAALGKRTGVKDEAMDWARAAWPDEEFPRVKKHFEHVADSLMAYNALKNGILVRAFG